MRIVLAIWMIHGLRGLSSRLGCWRWSAMLWLTIVRIVASAKAHSDRRRRWSFGVPSAPVELRLMRGGDGDGDGGRMGLGSGVMIFRGGWSCRDACREYEGPKRWVRYARARWRGNRTGCRR